MNINRSFIPLFLFIFFSTELLAAKQLFPMDNYIDSDGSITFYWNRSSVFSSVDLQISQDPSFLVSTQTPNIFDDSITIDGFLEGVDFYWRIAEDNNAWSDVKTFKYVDVSLISSLDFWLDPNEQITIDNGKISAWQDVVAGFSFDQSNEVYRPTIQYLNDVPLVRMGENSLSYLVGSSSYVANEFTLISMYQMVDISTPLGYLLGGVNSGVFIGGNNGSGWRKIGLYSNPNLIRAVGGADLSFSIKSCYSDKFFTNNNIESVTGAPVESLDFSTIGSRPGALNLYSDINLGDVMVFNDSLNDSTRLLVEDYLRAKYTPFPYLGKDTIVCGSEIQIGFRTDHGYSSRTWSTGETDVDSITVTQNGWYWAEVESFGWTLRDSVYIDGIVPTPQIDLAQSEIICYGDSLQVSYAQLAGFSPTWSTGETTSSIWVKDNSTEVYLTHEDVNGCSATSDAFFIRVDSLSLKSTLGPDKNICNGANVFVNTSSQDGPFGYQWSTGDITQSTSTTLLGVQDIDLILTDVNGCDFYDTVTVDALNLPSPNVAFEYDTTCPFLPTNFTDISTPGNTDNIISWAWNFYQNDSSYTQNPQYSFPQGSFTVSLSVETDSGCVNTGFQNVITHKQPIARLADEIVCANTPSVFTSTSLSPVPDIVTGWQWTVDGNTFFDEEISTVISSEGEHEVQLIAITNKGCQDTLLDTIEVFPALLPDFSVGDVCIGDSIHFVDETNSFSIVDWLWDFGHNNSFSAVQNPSYLYPSEISSYDVTLYVENAIGCENEITKQIEIHPLPIAKWHSESACVGEEVLFTDTSISPLDAVEQWVWVIEQDTFYTEDVSYVFDDAGDFPVSLAITTSNGCTDDTTGVVAAHAKPLVNFSFSPTYGTAPIDIQFVNESDDAVNFDWDFGDEIGTSTDENPIYTYDENGIYNISLTVANEYGCYNSIAHGLSLIPSELDLELRNLSLQVVTNIDGSKKIVPTIELHNVGTRLIENADLALRVENETKLAETWTGSITIGGAVSYTFDSYFLLPEGSSIDYVCIDAFNVNDNTEINLENNKMCKMLSTDLLEMSPPYPNPANEAVYTDLIMQNDGYISVDVIDMIGKSVKRAEKILVTEGYNKILIPTDNMLGGEYILRIKYQDEEYMQRFIVLNK